MGSRLIPPTRFEFNRSGVPASSISSIRGSRKRIAYSITESPFPMSFHSASMQVVEQEGAVQLEWTTDVLPDALAPELAKVIDSQIPAFAANLSN